MTTKATDYTSDVECQLFSPERIHDGISRIAEELTRDFGDKDPVLVCVTTGALVFCSDLMRQLSFPLSIDTICVSSYGSGHQSSGKLEFIKDLRFNIEDKHVIIVDDILDTGLTLQKLSEILTERRPASVSTCVLLRKDLPSKEQTFRADYEIFDCPNEFVVGYGLDYNHRYRNLPFIGVLKREVYE